jgi:hypothetical protein
MLVNPRPIFEEQSSIITTSIDEGGVQPSLETLAKWYVLGGETPCWKESPMKESVPPHSTIN